MLYPEVEARRYHRSMKTAAAAVVVEHGSSSKRRHVRKSFEKGRYVYIRLHTHSSRVSMPAYIRIRYI